MHPSLVSRSIVAAVIFMGLVALSETTPVVRAATTPVNVYQEYRATRTVEGYIVGQLTMIQNFERAYANGIQPARILVQIARQSYPTTRIMRRLLMTPRMSGQYLTVRHILLDGISYLQETLVGMIESGGTTLDGAAFNHSLADVQTALSIVS